MTRQNFTRQQALDLIAQTKRESDDFVDATAWCQRYGQEWRVFKQQDRVQKYIDAVGRKLDIRKNDVIQTKRGKNSRTFVHPLIFLELIRWLDVDVAVFANEVFQAYLEGNADIGLDMMLRDHNKDRQDRAKHRLKVVDANKQTASLAQKTGSPIATVHNDRYRGLYRQSAAQLRSSVQDAGIELRHDETPLNAMSSYDLSLNELANMMALKTGNPNTVFSAANGLRDWHKEQSGSDLEPTWESKRMSPSAARTTLNGQLELPVSQ